MGHHGPVPESTEAMWKLALPAVQFPMDPTKKDHGKTKVPMSKPTAKLPSRSLPDPKGKSQDLLQEPSGCSLPSKSPLAVLWSPCAWFVCFHGLRAHVAVMLCSYHGFRAHVAVMCVSRAHVAVMCFPHRLESPVAVPRLPHTINS